MMMRPLTTLMALGVVFIASAVFGQQNAYTFPSTQPYQPIQANTVSLPTSTVLPAAYQSAYAPMPNYSPTPSYAPLPAPRASLEATHPLSAGTAADLGTLIPLTLPGYELRVMDVTKRITFDLSGTPVAAEVPIFVYMPRNSASMADSTRELRKVYNDLIMLYDQERVDKERVRAMLKRLDSIIDTYDAVTPTVGHHSTPAESY